MLGFGSRLLFAELYASKIQDLATSLAISRRIFDINHPMIVCMVGVVKANGFGSLASENCRESFRKQSPHVY